MQKFLARFEREEGQTMAEYGVVLAVVTVAIVGVLTLLSDSIQNAIQNVIDAIS
jgi:Flp pilus assembly pilin Flp